MDRGLTAKDAQERLKQFGENKIETKRAISAVSVFLSQFPTFINGILITGALFSFFIGNLIDFVFIITIIILSGIFGFVQEYNAEKSLEKLKNYGIGQTGRVNFPYLSFSRPDGLVGLLNRGKPFLK